MESTVLYECTGRAGQRSRETFAHFLQSSYAKFDEPATVAQILNQVILYAQSHEGFPSEQELRTDLGGAKVLCTLLNTEIANQGEWVRITKVVDQKKVKYTILPPACFKADKTFGQFTAVSTKELKELKSRKALQKEIPVLQARINQLYAQLGQAQAELSRYQEATSADDDEDPHLGDRVSRFSAAYKIGLAQVAALLPGCGTRRTNEFLALSVYTICNEMKEHGLSPYSLRDICRVIPSYKQWTNIHRFASEARHWMASEDINDSECEGVVSISDKGNKDKLDQLVQFITYFDHTQEKVVQKPVDMDVQLKGGGGAAMATSVQKAGERLNIGPGPAQVPYIASVTDNALDAIQTFVEAMKETYPDLQPVGCVLHILNIVVQSAYCAAFGKDKENVCGAVRLGFMVHHLQTKFPEDWRLFEEKHPEVTIAYGASLGRWWSLIKSFDNILSHHAPYTKFMGEMHQTCKSETWGPIFGDVHSWLKSDKCMTDMQFMFDFVDEWLNGEMKFATGCAPWMQGMPEKDQIGGARAEEMPVRVIYMLQRLYTLSDSHETHTAFGRTRDRLSKCSAEHRTTFARQISTFFKVAIERAEKHLSRWLTTLLPCALAFETTPKVSYYLAGTLLNVIDAAPDSSTEVPISNVDPADEDIELWGEKWRMSDLINLLTQLVRKPGGRRILEEEAILTKLEGVIDMVRVVEGVGWDFQAAGIHGDRLTRLFRTWVKPIPITSILAERGVQTAASVTTSYATRMSDDVRAGKWVERREAIDAKRDVCLEAVAEMIEKWKRRAAEMVAECDGEGEGDSRCQPLLSRRGGPDVRRSISSHQSKAVVGKLVRVLLATQQRAAAPGFEERVRAHTLQIEAKDASRQQTSAAKRKEYDGRQREEAVRRAENPKKAKTADPPQLLQSLGKMNVNGKTREEKGGTLTNNKLAGEIMARAGLKEKLSFDRNGKVTTTGKAMKQILMDWNGGNPIMDCLADDEGHARALPLERLESRRSPPTAQQTTNTGATSPSPSPPQPQMIEITPNHTAATFATVSPSPRADKLATASPDVLARDDEMDVDVAPFETTTSLGAMGPEMQGGYWTPRRGS